MAGSFYPASRPVGGSVLPPRVQTPTTFGSVALSPSLARQGMAARYGATGSLGPMNEPTTGGISGWMAPYVNTRWGAGAVRGPSKAFRPLVRIVNPLKAMLRRLRPQYEAMRNTLVDAGDFGRVDELDRRMGILEDADRFGDTSAIPEHGWGPLPGATP